jgi:phosphopantetheinyl transferase (holo-ACP synthase)
MVNTRKISYYQLRISKSQCWTLKSKHKFKIEGAHFWDVETLSLLFQATTNTQQPFLRRVLSGKEKFKTTPLKRYVEKVFEKVFSTGEAKSDALDLSREIARMIDCELLQEHLKGIIYYNKDKYFKHASGTL